MDSLNARFGRGTVALASQGIGARDYDTKRAHLSPAWTTDLRQVPVAT